MTNFCNSIGLEQWYFRIIWNTYMWKLQTFCGYLYKQIIAWFVRDIWHKYHLWYFKIVSNFTRLTAREITYNNFEISPVVFMPNITTNHAITYTKSTIISPFCWTERTHLGSTLLEYFANQNADLSKFWSVIPILQPAFLHNVINLRGAVLRVFHTLSITEKVEETFHRYSGIRCPAKCKDLPQ